MRSKLRAQNSYLKLPRLSMKKLLFWFVVWGEGPHSDSFYDSRMNTQLSEQPVGSDGGAAGWTPPTAFIWSLLPRANNPGAYHWRGGSLCPCSIKGEGGLTRYQHEGTNGNSPLIHRFNRSQANMGASSRVKAVSAQYADQIKWGAHSRGSTWSIWSSTLPTSRSLMPPTCSTFCLTTALHAHFKLSLYRNDCHYRKVCTRVVHGMWPTPRLLLSPPASSAVYCIFIQNTARPSSRENRYICLLPVINKTQ